MKVTHTNIPDLLIVEPEVYEDNRGYFFEGFNRKKFHELGITADFVQDNQSKSDYGVLRGLHYQLEPFAQAKLVRVLQGKVLDVAVDLRTGSPTFKEWHSVVLSAENKRQLFIPRGFAHGFIVLSKTAEFFYKCDNYYSKQHEAGIRFDDHELNINWTVKKALIALSSKDSNLPFFKDAVHNFQFNHVDKV